MSQIFPPPRNKCDLSLPDNRLPSFPRPLPRVAKRRCKSEGETKRKVSFGQLDETVQFDGNDSASMISVGVLSHELSKSNGDFRWAADQQEFSNGTNASEFTHSHCIPRNELPILSPRRLSDTQGTCHSPLRNLTVNHDHSVLQALPSSPLTRMEEILNKSIAQPTKVKETTCECSSSTMSLLLLAGRNPNLSKTQPTLAQGKDVSPFGMGPPRKPTRSLSPTKARALAA